VLLPNDYDPAKAYPAVVALGGGPQDMNAVENILNRNFRTEAEKRGYIVVAPAAQGNRLFFLGEPASSPIFSRQFSRTTKSRTTSFTSRDRRTGG
jgi:dipeptidyl aminopeptidase/acylaminoacyl peptidase